MVPPYTTLIVARRVANCSFQSCARTGIGQPASRQTAAAPRKAPFVMHESAARRPRARRPVVVLAVDNPRLRRMKRQTTLLEPTTNRGQHRSGLLLVLAVDDGIVRVAFKLDTRTRPLHSDIERIMQEEIRQQRTDDTALRRAFRPFLPCAVPPLHRCSKPPRHIQPDPRNVGVTRDCPLDQVMRDGIKEPFDIQVDDPIGGLNPSLGCVNEHLSECVQLALQERWASSRMTRETRVFRRRGAVSRCSYTRVRALVQRTRTWNLRVGLRPISQCHPLAHLRGVAPVTCRTDIERRSRMNFPE